MGSSDNGSIMPDVYATITEADPATLERLVGAMEIRAAQPRQRAMLESYLSEVPFPKKRGCRRSAADPGPSLGSWRPGPAWPT
jgi:hypothetical protein